MSCTRPKLTRRASEAIGCASGAGEGQSRARALGYKRRRRDAVRNPRLKTALGRRPECERTRLKVDVDRQEVNDPDGIRTRVACVKGMCPRPG